MTGTTHDGPMLRIEDLSVSFGSQTDEVRAVRGVSFDVDRGETVALVGESGSGKSVTALSVLKLLPYPKAHHPGGRVLFDGGDLLHAAEPELRAVRGGRIGMIFQEPMTSLNPLHTIEKQIGETLQLHRGMSPRRARERILELLRLVGLSGVEHRLGAYPHQLSGGQRQRVMIAMALANEPDLLIADEPTTALDVTIQAQILTLLKSLQQRLGMGLLLITHDLNIVRHVADRVCVMTDGEVVEQGPVARIFAQPEHPYTRKLLDAEPSGRPSPVASDAAEVLAADEVRVWFPVRGGLLRRTVDHVRAVDGVSLSVRAGETVGIVGAPARSCALCVARCRSSSRTRSAASVRACRWRRSSRRGCSCTASAATRRVETHWWCRRSRRSGSIPRAGIATRTSSLEGSASVSPSPGRWCSNPSY
jgi:microcin C transport system ATP-binding protein